VLRLSIVAIVGYTYIDHLVFSISVAIQTA
jgi:hypothetical protein